MPSKEAQGSERSKPYQSKALEDIIVVFLCLAGHYSCQQKHQGDCPRKPHLSQITYKASIEFVRIRKLLDSIKL